MADIIEQFDNISFRDLHPSPTGGRARGIGGVDLPAWGGSDGLESKHVRCKQCGFIINRQRNPVGSGWGNIENEIYPITDFDSTSTPFDSSITAFDGNFGNTIGNAGCPLCGASEFE
jgi:hypothetical protein